MRWAFCDDGFFLVNWGPFKSLFGSLLMTVVQFLCLIVYFIETVFWTLIRGVKMNDGSYRNIIDGLLFNNANLADNSITTIAGIIILIAIGMVIFPVIVYYLLLITNSLTNAVCEYGELPLVFNNVNKTFDLFFSSTFGSFKNNINLVQVINKIIKNNMFYISSCVFL